MGDYADLPGVRTWYESEGAGDPLVLLHGGFCTNDTWGALRTDLAAAHRVFLPERRAHGHTPDVEGPLSYRAMADDTVDFVETVVGEPAHLVGWSDGGVVALLVALARPDLVRKAVVIGANFRPATECFAEPAMLDAMTPDAEDLAFFRELYEAVTPDGPDHWPMVAAKVVDMWRTQPTLSTEELARVAAPTLVVVGDDDLVTLEHTTALYRAIPGSQLAVVPGASHVVPLEKPDAVKRLVLDHLAQDAVETMMPVRRAAAPARTA
ncbi:putative hydrolase or acyltransferase [Streptomyces ambofaciens ATCC 23877]|uniref:Putative hydrolase or acyltransferase n=1 Tax=Streptomyces ambofaciens (strain ATCC 23877 / 3486 / DSM 40053 / JCM 4204 / NBRC 12836 / NRRL B-2516) TaxID=278992 RepID=A0ACP3_STRA7|nr:alpha/beta hydrolase [Streptomyces ambofaciens]AKZ60095.1 putative hydrolase or acyltransferase [Streptomyces ambofaciens ATCC 23877]CAJ88248.1 putative hydrolase or acyltransferase [Streptomyces ambofaciens ATCC 23877]